MLKLREGRTENRYEYQDKPEGEEVFKASLYYDKGGMNYFNYKNEPRGIYFSIRAMRVELRDGMRIESFMMCAGKGMKALVLPQERKSAVKLAKVAAAISPKVAEIVEKFKTDENGAFEMLAALMGAQVSA